MTGDGADTAPLPPLMPPRRDWGIFGLGFYKEVAPTALEIFIGVCGLISRLQPSESQCLDRINYSELISHVIMNLSQKLRPATFMMLCIFTAFDGWGQMPNNEMMLRSFFEPDRFPTCVAYGNGIFVAAGYGRVILVSKDGTNWLNRSSAIRKDVIGINFTTEIYTVGGDSITLVKPTDASSKVEVIGKNSFHFSDIGFGNNTFVILGESGEILISSDGESWRSVNAPTSANLTGIVWGGDKFVAVGDAGTILTSTDGVEWTSRGSGTNKGLRAVAFGNGVFVAVGGDMDNSIILTSNDGVTWIPNAKNYWCPIGAAAYGNGEFMASAGNGYSLTMVSKDGINWQRVTHPSSSLRTLTYGNGRFLAVDAWEQPVSSRDGSDWQPTFQQRSYGFDFYKATYGNGIFVAVGRDILTTSSDGVHWNPVKMPPQRMLCGTIVAQMHLFMVNPSSASSGFYTPRPLRSRDSQTWITMRRDSISGNINGNKTHFQKDKAGEEFAVLASDDGITWTRLLPTSETKLSPAVAKSAVNPTESNIGIAFQLNGQSYKLNLLAKVGQVYQLQASTDLEHWENLATITNNAEAFNFMDQDVDKYPQRFYRLKLQQ